MFWIAIICKDIFKSFFNGVGLNLNKLSNYFFYYLKFEIEIWVCFIIRYFKSTISSVSGLSRFKTIILYTIYEEKYAQNPGTIIKWDTRALCRQMSESVSQWVVSRPKVDAYKLPFNLKLKTYIIAHVSRHSGEGGGATCHSRHFH